MTPLPPYRGVFPRVVFGVSDGSSIPLPKNIDGRTSNWRFESGRGYCHRGQLKLLQYLSKSRMEKSKKWFLEKGFTVVAVDPGPSRCRGGFFFSP